MQVNGQIKHAKLLVEKLKDEVEKYTNTKFLAGAQITLAKGMLNESEMKSFLSALHAALSKFDDKDSCPINLTATVIAPEQVEIEKSLNETFGTAMAAEQKLQEDLAAVQAGAGNIVEASTFKKKGRK